MRRIVLAPQGQFKNRILYVDGLRAVGLRAVVLRAVGLRTVGFSVGGRGISCRVPSLLTGPSSPAFLLLTLMFFRFSLLLQKRSNELAQV